MKVYIGPYKSWYGPYQLCENFLFFLPKEWQRSIAERIPSRPFEWIHGFRKRKIKINLDDYDAWNVDDTLSLIIHPLLLRLKEDKHGAPHVDLEDVPKELRGEGDTLFFQRWDWVLDEMIFAFASYQIDWEEKYHSGVADHYWVCLNPEEPDEHRRLYEMREGALHTYKVDNDGLEKEDARIKNGFRLFGKYYQGLWS